MKPIKNKTLCALAAVALGWTALSLVACTENTDTTSVDLRYRVEDSYEVTAANPEVITIYVKSTLPWTVAGTDESWYSISPSHGEAGEKYEVTITCQENTGLDDREDTISISSDYWTGKKFRLFQKGTAYLNVSGLSEIEQTGGSMTFAIESNQKWTAAVTEGDIWLSIESGASGELDGTITVNATPNSGEQRTGIVSVYDRHGELAAIAECTEAGVILTPVSPEERSWFMLFDEAQTLEVPVEANAAWTVSKSDDEDDWFDLGQTSFDGDGTIVINIKENKGSEVRQGVVIVSTVAEEGATPLVKNIEFRQASSQTPKVIAENVVVSNGKVIGTGMKPGRYDFYLAPGMAYVESGVSFVFLGAQDDMVANNELSYWFDIANPADGQLRTWCRTLNYSSQLNRWVTSARKIVNMSAANKLTLSFYEYHAPDGLITIYSEYILNDELFGSLIGNEAAGGWRVHYDQAVANGYANLVCHGSGFTIERVEYTPAIDWGEYVDPEMRSVN